MELHCPEYSRPRASIPQPNGGAGSAQRNRRISFNRGSGGIHAHERNPSEGGFRCGPYSRQRPQKNDPGVALNYLQKAHTGNSFSISPQGNTIPGESYARDIMPEPKNASLDARPNQRIRNAAGLYLVDQKINTPYPPPLIRSLFAFHLGAASRQLDFRPEELQR
jgi:hypothetical protein